MALNWLDLIITSLCVAFYLFYLFSVHNSTQEEIGEVTEVILTIMRYILALARLIVFIKKYAQ